MGAEPLPETQPCQTRITVRGGTIQRVHIQANDLAVWRCMTHEAMHAMGIPGHPIANSVLTYFARSGRLSEIDKRLLRLIYSDALQPDMSPFAALALIARSSSGDARRAEAATPDAVTSLLRKIIADMERFGDGTGEPPAVVLRSSKATPAGIERGQRDVQFFLGIAYLQGHIVDRDRAKAIDWLSKAAAASHLQARRLLDRMNSQAARPAAEIAITH
jgi:TPR repeat protein